MKNIRCAVLMGMIAIIPLNAVNIEGANPFNSKDEGAKTFVRIISTYIVIAALSGTTYWSGMSDFWAPWGILLSCAALAGTVVGYGMVYKNDIQGAIRLFFRNGGNWYRNASRN